MNSKIRLLFSFENDDKWIVDAYKSFFDALKKDGGFEIFCTVSGLNANAQDIFGYNVIDYQKVSNNALGIIANGLSKSYPLDLFEAAKKFSNWGDPEGLLKRFTQFRSALNTIEPDCVIIWNGLSDVRGMIGHFLRQMRTPFFCAEKGMLPESWYIDSAGINAVCSLNKKSFFKIKTRNIPRINEYISKIVNSGSSAWDQPDRITDSGLIKQKFGIKEGSKVIFFPGQVDNDVNITRFCSFSDVAEAVELVLDSIPRDVVLVVKLHPKSAETSRQKISKLKDRYQNLLIINDANVWDLLDIADLVISINSTVAFEALLRKKKIILLGDSVLSKVNLVEKTGPGELKKQVRNYFEKDFERIFDYKNILSFVRFLIEDYYIFRNKNLLSADVLSKLKGKIKDVLPKTFSQEELMKSLYADTAISEQTLFLTPKISLVMANYNNGQYVGQAIQSVLNQTLTEWELIVVDDGSTDNSLEIINRYLSDKRIRLIQHPKNKGYTTALKTGIAEVRSDIFGILDSDDYLLEQALDVMYASHINNPDCGLIYSQLIYCDENLNAKNVGYCKQIFPGKTNLDTNCVSQLKTFKLRDYLKTTGYDEEILYAEDKDIIYKMEEVSGLKFVDKCLYLYRFLPDSLGHDEQKAAIGRQSMEKARQAALKRRATMNLYKDIKKTVVANKYDISLIGLESQIIDCFLRAGDCFRIGKFDIASQAMQCYRALVDYNKLLQIKGDRCQKGDIDISVVIVTHNRNHDLKKCLDSLHQSKANCIYEVLVVDNGLSDVNIFKKDIDLYIKCPINFNLSEGRNIGAYFARGKILAFLDDDALAGPNYLLSIKMASDRLDIFGLRGRAYPKNNPDENKSVSIYNLGDSPFPSYCNQEGNSAFRRDIYLEMGGMDPLLFGHEGSDLTYRIIKTYKQTNKVIYWPWTKIYHDFGSQEKAVEKKKLHQLSSDYLKFKHNADIFVNRREIEKCPLPVKQAFIPQAQNHPAPKSLVTPAIIAGNSKPKVSIVIACYNSQEFLPQCLDSIKNQTMTEWELLLVDDASTDGTRGIIEKYSRLDSRIKPSYFKDKQGPYVRRNFAIEKADSEFIVIQDSDDIMCPIKLQRLYEEITKDRRLGVVGSFYRLFLDEFKGLEYAEGVELPLVHEQIMEKYKTHLYVCWHASAIIRKSMFDAIGLYDENPYGSDKFWLAKAAEYVQYTREITFANIPEYLTLKREHASSQQGVLPPIDPRSRRAMFQTYWEDNLAKIREKFQKTPGLNVKAELRNCNCNDYIQRFSHLFEKWESLPLEENMLYKFVSRGIVKFKEGRHVTCLITLDGVEKILSTVAKRFKNYDLLRGMANFILDRKEKSIEYLNKEIQNHNNPAARQFISDFFENHSKMDVRRWCTENDSRYDLQIIDLGKASDRQQAQISVAGKQPLVSVIMPAYNAAEYIAKAIESVLNQTYKNFELIIINDGSTDQTENIILGFNDKKIKYASQENHGLAATHNTGIRKSSGEFVIKLDADDIMTPDFIARHIAEFEKHPEADLVYCDDLLIDENDQPIRVINRQEYSDRKQLIRDLFRCGFPVVPFRTCIRKNVFDKIGYFEESLRVAEDYDMMRRFVKHGLQVHHLPAALYLRRIVPDSLSRKFSVEKAKSHFDVVKRYADTFSCDELFPDVDWNKIAPEKRKLQTKCLSAVTCFTIGQSYAKTNAPVYAKTAFDQACSELDECFRMDPANPHVQQLLRKCEAVRTQCEQVVQEAVY